MKPAESFSVLSSQRRQDVFLFLPLLYLFYGDELTLTAWYTRGGVIHSARVKARTRSTIIGHILYCVVLCTLPLTILLGRMSLSALVFAAYASVCLTKRRLCGECGLERMQLITVVRSYFCILLL